MSDSIHPDTVEQREVGAPGDGAAPPPAADSNDTRGEAEVTRSRSSCDKPAQSSGYVNSLGCACGTYCMQVLLPAIQHQVLMYIKLTVSCLTDIDITA